jgi:hypothetical protein
MAKMTRTATRSPWRRAWLRALERRFLCLLCDLRLAHAADDEATVEELAHAYGLAPSTVRAAARGERLRASRIESPWPVVEVTWHAEHGNAYVYEVATVTIRAPLDMPPELLADTFRQARDEALRHLQDRGHRLPDLRTGVPPTLKVAPRLLLLLDGRLTLRRGEGYRVSGDLYGHTEALDRREDERRLQRVRQLLRRVRQTLARHVIRP